MCWQAWFTTLRCVTGTTYGKLHITRCVHWDAEPLLQLLAGWHNPWPQLLLLLLPLPLTLAAMPQHMALGAHMHINNIKTPLRSLSRSEVEQKHAGSCWRG
jgi:hypothetical protein